MQRFGKMCRHDRSASAAADGAAAALGGGGGSCGHQYASDANSVTTQTPTKPRKRPSPAPVEMTWHIIRIGLLNHYEGTADEAQKEAEPRAARPVQLAADDERRDEAREQQRADGGVARHLDTVAAETVTRSC